MSELGVGSKLAKEVLLLCKPFTTSWGPPGILFKEFRELTLGWKSGRRLMLTTYLHAFMACMKTAFHLLVSNQCIIYFTGSFKYILLTNELFITHLSTYLLSEIVPIIIFLLWCLFKK
jgi:hypothetical protein